MAVPQRHPVAPRPVILGVLRRLEGATVSDRILPSHPAPVLSCGRGVAALVRAIRDGEPALDTVGQRLAKRGKVARLQPGRTRVARHASRLGPSRAALGAAQLHRGFNPVALTAWAGDARAAPWWPQDPTTLALSGA
jgi:hypothetical protein